MKIPKRVTLAIAVGRSSRDERESAKSGGFDSERRKALCLQEFLRKKRARTRKKKRFSGSVSET